MRIVLVPGGFWEPAMTADRFWELTGVAAGLRALGHETVLFDRTHDAPTWDHDVAAVLTELTGLVAILAGSNGCSLAALAAVAGLGRVSQMVLGWPATANDPDVDASYRAGLDRGGVPSSTIGALLAGETLRGTTDSQLRTIINFCRVIPSVPANATHQKRTWRRLVELGAEPMAGCPEPPSSAFPAQLDRLILALDRAVA